MMIVLLLLALLAPSWVDATTYYISPTGSDANSGLSQATPWLTFAFAIGTAAGKAGCGDTLILLNGTYGNTTTTGNILVSSMVCTLGNEFVITALNQRQAKISDNGSNFAVRITASAYINVDGLYARSVDNSGSSLGYPFFVTGSNNIKLQNLVGRNPNRYANTHVFAVEHSTDVLVEDSEAYTFHRHVVEAPVSVRVTARRIYANPRGGRISGGFGAANGLGKADSLMSMYPCDSCVLENSIADGTNNAMYLNEQNATFDGSVLMQNAKVQGNICYKCNYANGIFLNSRKAQDLNHTPTNSLMRDNVFIDWASSGANGIRVSDGVGVVIDHLSIFGTGPGANGIQTDDNPATGSTAAQNSIAMTNILITGITPGSGFNITGFNTWTGDEIFSTGNGTAFKPALPANWTNTSTAAHGMGTCKLWAPVGAAVKGAGTGGSDIAGTVLYRYVDGVLTTTPLWDPVTGAFPHGANDLDGTNNVAGDSLKDFHTRTNVNVNSNGCLFPAGYGTSGGGGASTVVQGTTAVSGLSGTTSLSWNHTIAANQDFLKVCIALYDVAGNVGTVSAVDASGQSLSLIKRQLTTPSAYRNVEMWGVALPTAGLRTINVATTGTVTGLVGMSTEYDATSGVNTSVSTATAGPAATISITAPTDATSLVTDCVALSNAVSFSAGADQTALPTVSHSTTSVMLGSTHQNGSNGGVMSNDFGGTVYASQVAVSLTAGTPPPPTGALITQSDYLFIYPYGSESGSPPVLWWLSNTNAANIPIKISGTGLVRIRANIAGSVATTSQFNAALFCNLNGGSYSRAFNTFGSNVFRLYGAGAEGDNPQIPASGTPTTRRISGSSGFFAGVVNRDDASAITVRAMAVGDHTELDSVVKLNASQGSVISCRYEQDNGTPFDAYTNIATMTVIDDAAGLGF